MPFLNYLSESEVEAIHLATLRILSEVGILLEHPQARELLSAEGAVLRGERVLLPPELVETSIARCPSQVRVAGRGGSVKTLGDGSLYFHNLGGARDIYDPLSGGHRPAVLQDVRDATRLLDALPNCNTITPFFTPTDVPGPLMSLAMYRAAIPCTSKPLQGPGVQTAPEVRYALRLAEVLGDPTKILTLSVSPVSPLKFPTHEVDAMFEIARAGVPFGPLPCPTAGTTAPFAIAGAVAQQNAEVLAALVLVQLVRPGLPIIYCGRLAMMEPRSGISVWGGVELGLASAATVQIAHRYHLPVNVYGFSTNAHILDEQNGFERGLNAVIPALAGADELSGIGEMEAGVSSSLAQMVVDDEHAAAIQRLRRGIAVDEDALAVEVIDAAIQAGGNFMGQKHTVRRLKAGEVLLTRLAERGSWETWQQGGRMSLLERSQAEAGRILREHQVPPLEAAQEAELDKIMHAAQRELVGGGEA
jgi:trimethylamine--corrinoid protein Co-methyltransferase